LKTDCLILKGPRIGEVKTRLADAIGVEPATMIYRALVEHQCAEIPSEWEVTVHFTPADAEEEMRCWLQPHLRIDDVASLNAQSELIENILRKRVRGSF
jgi:glycosyltransferase A (GT-A) superfamily protein (DUF2064 family)